MKIRYLFFFLLNFLCLSGGLLAQKSWQLQLVALDSLPHLMAKNDYPKTFSDSASVQNYLNDLHKNLIDNGFLAASFDSVRFDSAQATAFLHTGQRYHWLTLHFDSLESELKRKLNLRPRRFQNRQFDFVQYKKMSAKIVEFYENRGYPFAQAGLNNVTFRESGIEARLVAQKNDFIRLDSLVVRGNAKLKPYFLPRYLNWQKGAAYDESKIAAISQRIRELPYINLARSHELEFSDKEVDVYLYLKNRKANRFSGILGILPSEKTSDKVLITGELNLTLQNVLQRGEKFSLLWRKLQAASQKLQVKTSVPYLFSSPLGVQAQFEMQKQDSSYLSLKSTGQVQYLLGAASYAALSLQSYNTSTIKNTDDSPFADVRTRLTGLNYRYQRLDYRFNPRRGFWAELGISTGTRQPKQGESQRQNRFSAKGELFFPLWGNLIAKLGNSSALIQSPELFENELFKIGGLQTLRGFDQQAFAVSGFSIFTVELRYVFEQNSAFYLFFDQAFYEKKTITQQISDTPAGLGAGMSFETRAGIFSLSYALGKQFQNPVQWRSAKIHFGYVSRF